MTVEINKNRSVLYGNGGATEFPFDFPVSRAEDLFVTETDADDVDTDLVYGSDFGITGIGEPEGGTVTIFTAPALDVRVTILRLVEPLQLTSFREQGTFRPATHEAAFDRIVEYLQQVEEVLSTFDPDLSRALVLGPNDVNGSGAYVGHSNRIRDLADPLNAQDAATRSYVESLVLSAIGNAGAFVPQRWQLTGDGVTTIFSIPGAIMSNPVLYRVTIDGVDQEAAFSFNIDTANEQISFASAPPDALRIVVICTGFALGITDQQPITRSMVRPSQTAPFMWSRDNGPGQGDSAMMTLLDSAGDYFDLEINQAP